VTQGHPSRVKLRLLLAGIVVVIAAGTIATAFTAPLATRHPLLLITLDARNRYLILARNVDLVPFLVIGTLRRLASDPSTGSSATGTATGPSGGSRPRGAAACW